MNKFKKVGYAKFHTGTNDLLFEDGMVQIWKTKKEAKEDPNYHHNFPLREVFITT